MAQVALPIVRVERFEPLASQRCVQKSQCPRSLWPLINRITLVHERANDATERVGQRSGVGLGFCQDLMERGGDPIPPRRTVMCVIGVAITKERREIAAAISASKFPQIISAISVRVRSLNCIGRINIPFAPAPTAHRSSIWGRGGHTQ